MPKTIDKIKEKIPGTAKYKKFQKSKEFALKVIDEWAEGETVYSQLVDRIDGNRSFYLGKASQQFNETTAEGKLRIPVNMGASILDLMVFLLANNPPKVQIIPDSASKLNQIEAAVKEDLLDVILKRAGFKKKFRDTAKMLVAFAGFTWWYPFWNNEVKFGKKKNKFDFSLLNPLTARVKFATTDYDKIQSFITTKRMTPEEIFKRYDGFECLPDSENPHLTETISGMDIEEGKTTVFRKFDSKNVSTVIDTRVAKKAEPHGFDFPPLIMTNNIWVLNDAHGHDDLERIKPIAQELNVLISGASEVARDLGWPALIEWNKALGGRKVDKWRGKKIAARKTDRGEGLAYLKNEADLAALLNQIKMLIELLHFVSLMPKAAAGVFDSSVTSGFQAKLAMQPATLSSDNKKIDLEDSVKELAKCALYLVGKKDPASLKIKLPDGTEAKLSDIHESDMEIIWPDNLPIDIAREVQNLVLGIQNSLTSVTQAIDKYNAMMGLKSPEDTKEYLQQEANNPELAPERALKVAQVKQTLSEIQTALGGIRDKVQGGLPGGLGEARENENPVNLLRKAASRLPEEQKPSPDTAKQAVNEASTGGAVPREA